MSIRIPLPPRRPPDPLPTARPRHAVGRPRRRPPRPRPPLRATSSSSGCRVLGPTATWLLRRLVAGFDHHPDGYELDVADTARGPRAQRHQGHRRRRSPRPLQRCVMFGVVQHAQPTAWVVRRRVPPISQRHLLRLPTDLQTAHEQWTTTTIHLDVARAGARAGHGDARRRRRPRRCSSRSSSPSASRRRPPPRPASCSCAGRPGYASVNRRSRRRPTSALSEAARS